jgi:hypothetical protein
MVGISEKWTWAQLSLAQAVNAHNAALGTTIAATVTSAAAISKAQDAESKAQDSLTIAQNAATKSQIAYTNAVHAHGIKSEQARVAAMNLQDADIRLKAAQDVLADSATAVAAAQGQIGQKVTGAALNLQAYQAQIDEFIKTNRRYISDQSEVVDGYAALIREGVSVANTNKDMAIALNIAAVQNISLSDAVSMLQRAEEGRMVGLKKLVGITLEAIPATASLSEKQAIVARNMAIVAAAYKNGTDALTPLQTAEDSLGNTWQDLAHKYGPAVIDEMAAIVLEIDKDIPAWDGFLNKINNVGNQLIAAGKLADQNAMKINNALTGRDQNIPGMNPVPAGPWSSAVGYDTNAGIYKQFGSLPTNDVVDPRTGIVMALNTTGTLGWHVANAQGKAGGGPVLPNSIYTVGELGPETLVMGSRGGTVIPNRGGGAGSGGAGNVTYNITVPVSHNNPSPWDIANEIHWEAKTRRLG